MTEQQQQTPELFQLDRATCTALLTTQRVGRLVVADDELRIVPVNYAVRDESILFRCDAGPRADAIAERIVAFEVDVFDDRTRSGWSIIVRGRAVALSTEAATAERGGVDTWAPGPKDRVFVVTIDDVTGRLLRGAVDESWSDASGYL